MAQMTWGQYAAEVEKTGGFTLLPVGQHNIRVDTTQVKEGKAGHKQILARFVVTDGPSVGKSILNNMAPFKNDGDPNGYFFQGLGALGLGRENNPEFWLQIDQMDTETGIEHIAQAMIGREATITVSHDNFNNAPRDNVKNMAPKGTPMAGIGVPGAAPIGGVPVMPIPNQPVATPVVVNLAATPAVMTPAAPAPAVPVAVVPTVPDTTAAAVQPVVSAVTTTAPQAAAPQLAPPPPAATQQPAPAPVAAPVAPDTAPVAAPPVAAPAVAENPVTVPAAPAPQAPPVMPPAAPAELLRPDEAPF